MYLQERHVTTRGGGSQAARRSRLGEAGGSPPSPPPSPLLSMAPSLAFAEPAAQLLVHSVPPPLPPRRPGDGPPSSAPPASPIPLPAAVLASLLERLLGGIDALAPPPARPASRRCAAAAFQAAVERAVVPSAPPALRGPSPSASLFLIQTRQSRLRRTHPRCIFSLSVLNVRTGRFLVLLCPPLPSPHPAPCSSHATTPQLLCAAASMRGSRCFAGGPPGRRLPRSPCSTCPFFSARRPHHPDSAAPSAPTCPATAAPGSTHASHGAWGRYSVPHSSRCYVFSDDALCHATTRTWGGRWLDG